MNRTEQECLLLRQIASLRRRGVSRVEALALAADGLPNSPLRETLRGIQRALSSGNEIEPRGELIEDLLSRSDSSVEQLEVAAQALDARLWADSALRTTRLYLQIGLMAPILLLTLIAWLQLLNPIPLADHVLWSFLNRTLLGSVALLGLPLALVAGSLVRRYARSIAPGFQLMTRSASMLQVSLRTNAAQDPESCPTPIERLGETMSSYYVARRARVGASQATRELALELLREGKERLFLFRQIAPLVGAALAMPLFTVSFYVLYSPIFRLAGNMGSN